MCRGCGIRIEKADARLAILVPCVAISTLCGSIYGWVSAAALSVLAATIIIVTADAYVFSKIRLSAPPEEPEPLG
ncbi:hypothetical protein D3C85_1273800 [compost metagenome]